MKTYAEQEGQETFDWNKFLAKDVTELTSEETDRASALAGDWVTCACGNQCDIIPRDNDGTPEDVILYNLGIEFYSNINDLYFFVSEEDFTEAEEHRLLAIETLAAIEKKSSEIINEIKRK